MEITALESCPLAAGTCNAFSVDGRDEIVACAYLIDIEIRNLPLQVAFYRVMFWKELTDSLPLAGSIINYVIMIF